MLILICSIVLLALTYSYGGVIPEQFVWASVPLAGVALWATVRRHSSLLPESPSARDMLPIALLFAYACLQIVPMPQELVRMLWPERAEVLELATRLGMPNLLPWSTISLQPTQSFNALLVLGTALCMFRLAYSQVVRHRYATNLVLLPVFVVTGFEAVAGLYQYQAGGYPEPLSGTFVNRNHFAAVLCLGLPLFLGKGWQSLKASTRSAGSSTYNGLLAAVFFALAACSLSGIVLSGSRGGLVSAVVTLAALTAFRFLRPLSPRRALAAAGLSVIIVACAVPAFVSTPVNAASEQAYAARDSLDLRVDIWKRSFSAFSDHWLLGAGLGAFEDGFAPYNDVTPGKRVDYAHNDYLQLVVETGIIGAALAAWALFLLVRKCLRLLSSGEGPDQWIQLGAISALCGLAVHEFVDFNLAIPAIALVVAWLAGIVVASSDLIPRRQRLREQSRAEGLPGTQVVSLAPPAHSPT